MLLSKKTTFGQTIIEQNVTIPEEGYIYVDTEIFINQFESYVNYWVNLVFYKGEINNSIYVDRTNQIFSSNDYILFVLKYFFPILAFVIAMTRVRKTDEGEDKSVNYFKQTMIMVGFSLFLGFIPLISAFVFFLIILMVLWNLHFYYSDDNQSIAILVLLMMDITMTPISTGRNYLSTKLINLDYHFILYPWFSLIIGSILVGLFIQQQIHFLRQKYPNNEILYNRKLRDRRQDDAYQIIILTIILMFYYVLFNRMI